MLQKRSWDQCGSQMRQEAAALRTGEERAKVLTVGTGAQPGGAAGSIPPHLHAQDLGAQLSTSLTGEASCQEDAPGWCSSALPCTQRWPPWGRGDVGAPALSTVLQPRQLQRGQILLNAGQQGRKPTLTPRRWHCILQI